MTSAGLTFTPGRLVERNFDEKHVTGIQIHRSGFVDGVLFSESRGKPLETQLAPALVLVSIKQQDDANVRAFLDLLRYFRRKLQVPPIVDASFKFQGSHALDEARHHDGILALPLAR